MDLNTFIKLSPATLNVFDSVVIMVRPSRAHHVPITCHHVPSRAIIRFDRHHGARASAPPDLGRPSLSHPSHPSPPYHHPRRSSQFLIPVVDRLLYPALRRCGIDLSMVAKIAIGFGFAGLSVVCAGVVEVRPPLA